MAIFQILFTCGNVSSALFNLTSNGVLTQLSTTNITSEGDVTTACLSGIRDNTIYNTSVTATLTSGLMLSSSGQQVISEQLC